MLIRSTTWKEKNVKMINNGQQLATHIYIYYWSHICNVLCNEVPSIPTFGCQKSSYFDASNSEVRPTSCISFFLMLTRDRYLSNSVTIR